MNQIIDILSTVLVLSNFYLLASSRLLIYVKIIALQGFVLGVMTFLAQSEMTELRFIILGLGNIVLKSIIVPWLFIKAIHEARIRREVEPLVSYSLSLFFGIASFAASMWLASRLPGFSSRFTEITIGAVFFMMFTGLFLIVSRTKAITQVIGYLIFENGIYLFGVSSVAEAPLFVELGVFLDIVVTVFIMAIIVHHIDRRFDTLNIRQLNKTGE
jgi:hydrogenase-4 component E